MSKPLIFFFRIVFLLFFFFGAWNTINNIEQKHKEFAGSYGRFVGTVEKKVGVVLPVYLSKDFMEENSLLVLRAVSTVQLLLIGLSLLVWNGFTGLLGLVNLVMSCIQVNVASFDMNKGLVDWEPVLISVALFGASLLLSQSGEKRKMNRKGTDKSQEERNKREIEKKTDELRARRNRRRRD